MINWEAVGAVAELTGALGVIASLLYLAIQVRNNTRSIRTSTYQALLNTSLDFSFLAGSEPNVALTFNRGLRGDELSPQESAQFAYLLHGVLRSLENGHYQFINGTMDPELWSGWTETARGIIGSPGGRQRWAAYRPRLRSSFVEFVEREVISMDTQTSVENLLDAADGGEVV